MKNLIIGLALLILAGLGIYFFTMQDSKKIDLDSDTDQNGTEEDLGDVVGDELDDDNVTEEEGPTSVIGTSVDGQEILAYHFGTGEKEILFVGGIHGGYAWNTVALNYELIKFLDDQSEIIPENVRVTVIPLLNPDGLLDTLSRTTSSTSLSRLQMSAASAAEWKNIAKDILVKGRFNANKVDLNRNFDCEWQSVGTWQNTEVSGGTAPFSEPESIALKNYVESHNISAAVVYYSSAGGVFTSSCNGDVLAETSALTKLYAKESGYKEYQEFDFYEITGDMVNWLAKKEIPAISVLLSQHNQVEWSRNLDAIKSVLEYYAE